MTEQLLTTSEACQVHSSHRPIPRLNHRHHVWPLGEGGPDIPDNLVTVCPTGHVNIHELLRLLKKHKGQVPPDILNGYRGEERRLAILGYTRILQRQM